MHEKAKDPPSQRVGSRQDLLPGSPHPASSFYYTQPNNNLSLLFRKCLLLPPPNLLLITRHLWWESHHLPRQRTSSIRSRSKTSSWSLQSHAHGQAHTVRHTRSGTRSSLLSHAQSEQSAFRSSRYTVRVMGGCPGRQASKLSPRAGSGQVSRQALALAGIHSGRFSSMLSTRQASSISTRHTPRQAFASIPTRLVLARLLLRHVLRHYDFWF